MIAIYFFVSILSIIAITSILYFMYKEHKAMRMVLEESKIVKTELEDYMERCIKLSNEIVLQLNKPIDKDHISIQEIKQVDNHIKIESKKEEKPPEKIFLDTKKEDKKNKKIDPYKEEINKLIEESRINNNQEYSAKKIFEILSAKYPDTFNISYRTLAYYVSEIKKSTLKKASKNDKNQISHLNELKIVKKPILSEEKKEDNFFEKEKISKFNNLREIKIDKEYNNNTHPYEIVESLYEKGHSIRQIAQIMGKGQGEIALILNLQKKKLALK